MMKKLLCFFVIVSMASCHPHKPGPEKLDRQQMANQVIKAFEHAWSGYRQYAWGHDALKPLSESSRDWYDTNLYMTPVDAFDTMILMGLSKEASEAKALVLQHLSFDHDMSVQVFEITIRLLGGLISAYQLDGDKRFLDLAVDLANRLLPAFNSKTGMPYRFVNLRSGAIRDSINNPAEIGTLMLEFGTVSKLTGNPVFFDKAKKAFTCLYEHRSTIGLVGTQINVETGEWVRTESHISGMIDSYYEYMLKAAILFDDDDFRNMWRESIQAVNHYLADTTQGGLWYRRADMNSGKETRTIVGALDAFFPAVLVLGDDIEHARQLEDNCYNMWISHGIEPEAMNYVTGEILDPAYMLRPENIESCTYLYHKTGDPAYLSMGKNMFESIVKYCEVDAGFAAISDVRTMEKMDDMESFFFAETLKYSYLLFADIPGFDFNHTIFNTEAHPIRKTW
jgi:mannosidase alpha-like ER degradation enhancer 2